MTNYETAMNLKDLLQKAKAAIPIIEDKIRAAEKLQPDLDAEAVKAKALEAKDAKKKEEGALANRASIGPLRDELEQAKRKVEIIEAEQRKLEGAACQDVRKKYWPEYERTVREFIAQANKAAELEQKIRQMKDQAQAEVDLVRVSIFFTPLPPLRPILLAGVGDLPEYGPLARLIADLKAAGIEL